MPKNIQFGNVCIEYETIERRVKYPRLEFQTGELVMIVPENYDSERELLEKKATWIIRKAAEIETAKKNARKKIGTDIPKLTQEELKEIAGKHILEYAGILNVTPSRISFKGMKTKWGSCSARGNLTFNKKLRYLPERLIRYVLYHELVHLLERKHSERFWSTIEEEYPDYQKLETELLEYWFFIQERNQDPNIG